MQRSDWSKRPLSDKQIDYARLDTHYLPELYEQLYAECVERDRLMIVESECRRLEKLRPVQAEVQPNDFVKVKGARELSPVQRAVFKELFVLRDSLARESDKPTFRVINNQALLDVAHRRPKDYRALTAIKGFTPRMATRMGDMVLDAVVRGLEADPIVNMPRAPRKAGTLDMDDATQELHERLKRWRKKVSDSLGIESAYVLNRHILGRLALDRPNTQAKLESIEGIQDWQLERFSDGLIETVTRFLKDEKAGTLPTKRKNRGR
jgi:ribonuclease D